MLTNKNNIYFVQCLFTFFFMNFDEINIIIMKAYTQKINAESINIALLLLRNSVCVFVPLNQQNIVYRLYPHSFRCVYHENFKIKKKISFFFWKNTFLIQHTYERL